MSEKGGKLFTAPQPQKRGRKPSLKSTNGKEAPLKGKDDSSEKSKKGRKVKFDTGSPEVNLNFSSEYGGNLNTDTPTTFPKGSFGLGGKGDKTGKGGKSFVPKPSRPLELSVEDELPKGAKCLMDCEAADILEGIQDRMVLLSKDPSIKIPKSFDSGLQYAKRDNHYTSSQSVKDILDMLSIYGLKEAEICVIANICPETADEVFALLPSLQAKKNMLREPIKDVLLELAKHYSSVQKILLVGDGDFSFSLSLARAFGSARNMVATSLDSLEKIKKNYSDGIRNIMELEERGCVVLHGVDGKHMSDHFFLKTQRFDRIIYNFPHVGFHFPEENCCQIQMNKTLVKEFMKNAKALLRKENGEIHISHKEGDPYEKWNLVKKAEKIGLHLHDTVPFYKNDYPGYQNKRAHGSSADAPFQLGQANTYKFRLITHPL
uniref:RNA polymerase Rpb4/RPC9 core domain-containing protein n=1 Tax=Cannabis sativa TaxID=3483 RepID=A0A803NYJ9_CANSA